jgi:hypothetical protein
MAVFAGFAVCVVPTLAAETTDKFDGIWSATTEPSMGRNCALGNTIIRYDFTVRKGRIDGTIKAGFGVHKLTGLIQSDGSVNDFATVGLIPWSFAGKFAKDSAAGKFQGRTCSGKFLFLRKTGP